MKTKHRSHLEVYRGHGPVRQPFYWRKRGANGRIVAVSGEGFARRRYAAVAARREYPGLTLEHLGTGR